MCIQQVYYNTYLQFQNLIIGKKKREPAVISTCFH